MQGRRERELPAAKISSAVPGELIRLVVHKGIPISPFIFWVTHVKAPRGTIVAMVGIRASCQPMPGEGGLAGEGGIGKRKIEYVMGSVC